jgi:hypothetical protein
MGSWGPSRLWVQPACCSVRLLDSLSSFVSPEEQGGGKMMTMASDKGAFAPLAFTTLAVAVILFFGLAACFPWIIPLNFALGAAIGLVSLGALHWMVLGLGASDPNRARRALWLPATLHLGKYALIGLVLYLLFASGYARVPALAGGFTLPTAVLCLREARGRLKTRFGVQNPASTGIEETARGSPGVEN